MVTKILPADALPVGSQWADSAVPYGSAEYASETQPSTGEAGIEPTFPLSNIPLCHGRDLGIDLVLALVYYQESRQATY